MLLRLLVLLFALNAIAPVAMASVDCDMMNDMDMTSMTHDMSELDCCTDHDDSCNTKQCITSSSANVPLLSLDNVKNFAVDVLGKHPKDNLLSLYEIFLPINTPPPLV